MELLKTNNSKVCIKITNGKREAVMLVNPKNMDCEVVHCNWIDKCMSQGILINGQCPKYCDLVSGAKQYLRGRKRKNLVAQVLPQDYCNLSRKFSDQEINSQKVNINNYINSFKFL